MSSGDIRAKACAKLRTGAVTIRQATTHAGERRACAVEAKVTGHTGVHTVEYSAADGWSCSCGRAGDAFSPCPHVAAVQMVTGHPSAALREVDER
ncbi:MAG: hypothetical protein JWM93_3994 [Frankiales bacterium]|nr:hypothetical protein [Frankiales bacterium]